MATPRHKLFLPVAVGVLALVIAVAALVPRRGARDAAGATGAAVTQDKRWQAVAPGRVEPASGEIRIAAPVVGRVDEVLVKVGDAVFAGEPLIRLDDEEIQARLLAAQAQVALRKRARDDQPASGGAATRRKAEDAVADGERAVVEARSALDRAAAARRVGNWWEADTDAARATLTRAQDQLKEQKDNLRRIETGTPLPRQTDGQLSIARAELLGIAAAIEKMTIRAPIAGTVLQINAKAGEPAAPPAAQPLVVLGDISALRVRAELDERDFGKIKVGQRVLVRALAFREREIAGQVSSIAPIVQSGRITSRDQRNLTDVNVAEVIVDLVERGPLAVGMKVEVYFRSDAPPP